MILPAAGADIWHLTLPQWIVLVIGAIGILWYYFSLLALGLKQPNPQQPNDGFRQFMSLSVTTIGSTLATFVGSLLGLKSAVEKLDQTNAARALLDTNVSSSLQWWSAGLYLLSLIIALLLWWRAGNNIDPAVSNLGKSILGLIGGALAIVFNLQQLT